LVRVCDHCLHFILLTFAGFTGGFEKGPLNVYLGDLDSSDDWIHWRSVRQVVISVAWCVVPLNFFCRIYMLVETFMADFGRFRRRNRSS